MQIKGAGSYVRVLVSRSEVEAFKAQWPCSGLKSAPVAFTFSGDGELTDIQGMDWRNTDAGEALSALSEDARQYVLSRGVIQATEALSL